MTRKCLPGASALGLIAIVGCSADRPTGPPGRQAFERYVAVGTSLSMGVESDGVVYFSQQHDWTNLLAHQAGGSFAQPLAQGPGCFSPLIPPLELNARLSGISASADPTTSAADTNCALLGDRTLPTNDVAVDGADTYDALFVTPESASVEGVKRRRQYHLVLPKKTTQITAMLRQEPTLVSIELGANEVLDAASGLLRPKTAYRGAGSQGTVVPNSIWKPVYDQLVDSVKKTGAKVLLVGIPQSNGFVALRTGDELYQDRVEFQDMGVVVADDCQGSANSIFVPGKVTSVVASAQASGQPQTLSCADQPGTQDNILTPADIQTLDALIDGMNAHIRSVAETNSWAFLDLASLWAGWAARRATFSVHDLFSCVLPYGQYVSLDGVHPNLDGYQEMANAAADALNATYGFAISTNSRPVLAQTCQ
ncbi:MAG: GDSL-type esterase/lipase family protein [Gemmatimonadaceae bacterium]